MNILFITAEVEHYGATGPAAHVCAALPKALRALGHKVLVVSPLYRGIDPAVHSLARRLSKLTPSVAGQEHSFEVYTGRSAAGVDLVFLGHEELFHSVNAIDEGGDIARRAGAFAAVAAAYVESQTEELDRIHAHGPAGAAALKLLADAGSKVPRLLTVHDAGQDGEVLGIQGGALRAGIASADRLTVVSESYLRDMRQGPLADVLPEQVPAIVSGIDASVWNPLTDQHIPARFDPEELSGKTQCKLELQRKLALPVREDVPLLGLIGKASPRSGFDVVAKVASQLLRNDMQIVALVGEGDGALVGTFEELWERWPDRVQVRTDFDKALRHQVYAASDLLLVPPPDAPATIKHMLAHRYGSVPIVHRTGALADGVVDVDAGLESGTGFAFEPLSAEHLLGAVRRGIAAFEQHEAFRRLQARVMRVDHSWDRSARRYEALYRELGEEDE